MSLRIESGDGQDSIDAGRGDDQHVVTRHVTKVIVDLLEEIEIDLQYGKRGGIPPCTLQGRIQSVEEQRAIRQTSQNVIQTELLETRTLTVNFPMQACAAQTVG